MGDDTEQGERLQRVFRRLAEGSNHILRTKATLEHLYSCSPNNIANHALIIHSNSSKARSCPDIEQAAQWCLDNFVPVFFVCDENKMSLTDQVPRILEPINGMSYREDAELVEIGLRILNLIGYDERERSIFISYRRSDGSRVAGDLRHALIDRGWDVFMDTFNIAPGVDFQKQLDRDLEGRSLVLVLETPDITSSMWVGHEIAYAKRHGIGLHALQLPNTTSAQTVTEIDTDRRTKTKRARFEERVSQKKIPVGLIEVLEVLQRTHTRSLRARHRTIMESVIQTLTRAGYGIESVDQWAVRGFRADRPPIVVLATPRFPRVADIRHVQQLRRRDGSRRGCAAFVVHPLVDPESDALSLLNWICRKRPITVCRFNELQRKLLK